MSDKINGSLSHVFNEIYCSEYDKWIMIDVSENLYFIDTRKKFPLSATEYIDLLSSEQSHKLLTINILTGKEDDALKENERIQKLYFTPSNLFCLVVNFKAHAGVFPLLKKVLPVAIMHVLLVIMGLSARYIVYVNPHSKFM